MGINCKIHYNQNNEVDFVEKEDGTRSELFDELRTLFGTEKALDLYALSETEDFKYIQDLKNKPIKFSILGEKGAQNQGQHAEKEVIDRLKQSGLAENVFEMNTQEIDAKLAELGVDAETRKQIMAYHGSPHSFDRFTTEKMGTGEGVQAFSWGLYFTDLESIAKNYASNLANLEIIGAPKKVNEALNYVFTVVNNPFRGKSDYISKEELESFLSQASKYAEGEQYGRGADEELFKIVDIAWSYVQDNYDDIEVKANRNLYKVSLHKGKTPDQYTWLEWDKPVENDVLKKLSSNKEFTEKYIKAYGETSNLEKELVDRGMVGKDLYKMLTDYLNMTPKQASLFLLDNGVDGVKYPAESISRGATSDTARGFNYVVFDENAITIEEQIQFSKALNRVGIDMIVNGFVYNEALDPRNILNEMINKGLIEKIC